MIFIRIMEHLKSHRNYRNKVTSIMDLLSRKIISCVFSTTLEAIDVVACVEKAKQRRNISKPLIFHCDRGRQYVSDAFRSATVGMINSYSKKAISLG